MLMMIGVLIFVVIFVGVVFMGVNSYIGNVLNFMVKVIVELCGVKMLSFFVYFGWVFVVLILVFLLMLWFFFMV